MYIRILYLLSSYVALMGQEHIPADELEVRGAPYVPPTQTTLRVETRLVEVNAVVRDSNGSAVAGLTRDDFELEDAGKKQEIRAFSTETAAAPRPVPGAITSPVPLEQTAIRRPRFLALIFDDSSMTPSDVTPTRAAAKRFLAQGLQSGDLSSIFIFSKGQVTPFTSDTGKLKEALHELTAHPGTAAMTSCPYLSPYDALNIVEQVDTFVLPAKVRDAKACGYCGKFEPSCESQVEALARRIWEETQSASMRILSFLDQIVKYMATMPGRRVMVLASSGFLSRTLEQQREGVIDRALRAGVVINSLDAKGLFTDDTGIEYPSLNQASNILQRSLGLRPQDAMNDSLAVLAASTGGLFFHNNNDLALGFRTLGLAPAVSYDMGFYPTGAPNKKYHALTLRLKKNGRYSIQARPGYFASITPPNGLTPERAIDKAVLSGDTPSDVPATVSASSVATRDKRPALRVLVHLDVPRLPFTEVKGVRTLHLDIIAALFGKGSAFVRGEEAYASFALKDATFLRLVDGMNLALTLNVPPGKYQLRCVVEEARAGKFTSILQPVEVQPAD